MTEPDYQKIKSAGKIQKDPDAPDPGSGASDAPAEHRGYSLDDFLPVLVPLLIPKIPLTVAPAFTPKTFMEAVQLFDDGSTRALYLYISGAWQSIPLGATATATGRSYLSSAQSISTTFNTKITFDTNSFANGITWDGTNNRFTCVTAGKYLVTSALQWSSPTTNFQYSSKLYKNGAEVSRGSFIPANFAGFASSHITDVVSLAVGDYIEVFAFQGSGGSVNISGGSTVSFLAIAQLST